MLSSKKPRRHSLGHPQVLTRQRSRVRSLPTSIFFLQDVRECDQTDKAVDFPFVEIYIAVDPVFAAPASEAGVRGSNLATVEFFEGI